MGLEEKLEKIKSSGKFDKPKVSKYGLGTFLPLTTYNSIIVAVNDLKEILKKRINDPKTEVSSFLSVIFECINYILLLEKENPKESIKEYKILCKYICEIFDKNFIFNKIFYNVRMHYLNIEIGLVLNNLEENRAVDKKCLGYFLKEFKYYGDTIAKTKTMQLIKLENLEEEIKKEFNF